MAFTTYVKDPNAVLDYLNDWSSWLPDGDLIIASTWTAETGITIDNANIFTTTTATVWLSGGTAGSKYVVTNRITTAEGRVNDKSILINCKEQ